MNFTLKKVQPEDRSWGGLVFDPQTNTSRWSGMVGMLAEGRADLCSATLTITKERAKVGFIE